MITNLTATPVSGTQINLTWEVGGNTTSAVRIEVSPDGVVWSTLADKAAGTTTYADTGLSANQTRHYRVSFTEVVVAAGSTSCPTSATTPNLPSSGPLTFEVFDPQITPIIQTLKNTNPTGWWSWGVAAVDLRNNGVPDLVFVCHSGQGGIIVRRQSGPIRNAVWVDVTTDLGVTHAQVPHTNKPIIFDFDNDGRLDILQCGSGVAQAKNLRNTGTSLEVTSGQLNPVGPFDATIADYNGDGYLDVQRLTDHDYGKSYRDRQYNNSGNGTFTFEHVKIEIPSDLPQSIKDELLALESDTNVGNRYAGPTYWRGDLFGNGREDVIVQYTGSYAGTAYRFGRYLRREADETLTDVTATCGIPPNLVPILPPCDIRRTGKKDIVCGYGSTSTAGLYRQNENGTFTLQRVDSLPASSTKDLWRMVYATNASYTPQLRWVDFNNDGKVDLFVSNMRLGLSGVYEQQEDGRLVEKIRIPHADGEGWAIVDLDGDGRPDIVTFGSSSHEDVTVKFYLNTSGD